MSFKLAAQPAFYPGKTLVYPYKAGDPVVDTGVDLYGEHRVYLGRTEAFEAAREMAPHFTDGQRANLLKKLGVDDPDAARGLAEQLQEAHRQIENLKANLVVPLADVIDLMEERAKRRPVAVVEEPVA